MRKGDVQAGVRSALKAGVEALIEKRAAEQEKVARLRADAAAAGEYEQSVLLRRQLEKAEWNVEQLDREITKREARLEQEVEAHSGPVAELLAKIERHTAEIAEAARANLLALEHAAATNQAAIHAVDDARRALGDGLLARLLPAALPSTTQAGVGVFRGLLTEDLVHMFATDTERRLAACTRSPPIAEVLEVVSGRKAAA